MSSIIALGTFERVPLRDAWPTEDGNFTPWLAETPNVSLLGEALDIELEVEAIACGESNIFDRGVIRQFRCRIDQMSFVEQCGRIERLRLARRSWP
jgi:hypothetical protein